MFSSAKAWAETQPGFVWIQGLKFDAWKPQFSSIETWFVGEFPFSDRPTDHFFVASSTRRGESPFFFSVPDSQGKLRHKLTMSGTNFGLVVNGSFWINRSLKSPSDHSWTGQVYWRHDSLEGIPWNVPAVTVAGRAIKILVICLGTSHDKNGVTGNSLMKAILMQESVICG